MLPMLVYQRVIFHRSSPEENKRSPPPAIILPKLHSAAKGCPERSYVCPGRDRYVARPAGHCGFKKKRWVGIKPEISMRCLLEERCFHEIYGEYHGGCNGSMDWFKGKSTGNHGFYHQI